MALSLSTRLATARAALAAAQQARRSGPVSARTERRDRQRAQAVEQHPTVVPRQDVPPPLTQAPTPDMAPADDRDVLQ
jgi:hypothetical protein